MRTSSVCFFTALVASTLALGYACGGSSGSGGTGGTNGSGGSGGAGGGGGAGGSKDYAAVCQQACAKAKTCPTYTTLDCNALCSTCKAPAMAADQATACLAVSDCTQLGLCFLPVLSTCAGSGSGGAAGTGGVAGTGGLTGSSGGVSGGGGLAGSKGGVSGGGGLSGGTGGAGGNSGSDCTASCTKAYKCCMAALGTSVCNQLDPTALCASASTASAMAASCQKGLAQYGQLSTAAACH